MAGKVQAGKDPELDAPGLPGTVRMWQVQRMKGGIRALQAMVALGRQQGLQWAQDTRGKPGRLAQAWIMLLPALSR